MRAKLISFVVAQAPGFGKRGIKEVQTPTIESAPHYFEATVPRQFLVAKEKIVVNEVEGQMHLKMYKPDILLAEAHFDLPDVLSDDALDFKKDVLSACRAFLGKKGARNAESLSEEYSVAVVTGYEGEPEQFFEHQGKIASFLKSEKLVLDLPEIEYTLKSQLKYAKNDLVIVDWDGAFIFDTEGDFESSLELFELANLQLLQYRILDEQLDKRLHHVSVLLEQAPKESKSLFRAKDVNQVIKETMLVRSQSLSEFHTLDRDIKLIGDWYSARLYDLVAKKFKLDIWHDEIKEKIDAVENVYSVASENFTMSWERRGRVLEMIGWYVLLFGWLILLIADFYFYKWQ
jgi:hypothetical protein